MLSATIVRRPPHSRARVCALLVMLATAAAAAQPPSATAGRLKVATGTVSIVRGADVQPATAGAELRESDIVRTGADGRAAIMLKDESRLSLGPNTELALARFAFAPQDQQLALTVRLTRGVLSYVSGIIAKLAPEAVRLQTPTSVIGVRGTHVLVRAEAP
ncbi:FecR family protein [uncultured Phenylobacterium sp.]|uniref:FecR family protein n=1 Tax=uncultured Phenylobacterium sp. TaxID=349273 RepID=UPI0025E7E6D2|nr:FecR family protein [uncultured Phenylobacterium sp.]